METKIEPFLPEVHLQVSGDVFYASGDMPYKWKIYAEAIDEGSACTQIRLDDVLIANITVHIIDYRKENLVNETQEISAALLWSAIRAKYMKERK